jgi:prepilin-type processing-associated H-X9-DG protein
VPCSSAHWMKGPLNDLAIRATWRLLDHTRFWGIGKGIKMAEIKDGLSNTIMLIEMKNSGISWSEPRDLDLDHLPKGLTHPNLLESVTNHPGIINVAFADGSVRAISTSIPWELFVALTTIDGGETIDQERLYQ